MLINVSCLKHHSSDKRLLTAPEAYRCDAPSTAVPTRGWEGLPMVAWDRCCKSWTSLWYSSLMSSSETSVYELIVLRWSCRRVSLAHVPPPWEADGEHYARRHTLVTDPLSYHPCDRLLLHSKANSDFFFFEANYIICRKHWWFI
jgi:hypothetical protein